MNKETKITVGSVKLLKKVFQLDENLEASSQELLGENNDLNNSPTQKKSIQEKIKKDAVTYNSLKNTFEDDTQSNDFLDSIEASGVIYYNKDGSKKYEINNLTGEITTYEDTDENT